MRILIVSNRYPPYYTGGYELNCTEAVIGLRQAGHQVRVLTSAWGIPQPLVESAELQRTMTPCFDFWLKRHHPLFSWRSLWQDRQAAKTAVKDFVPDLIYVWNMDWSSIAALYTLQSLGKPMVYHFGAPWLNTYAERVAHLRRDPFSRLLRLVSGQTWGWDYRHLRIDAAIPMTNFIKSKLLEAGWIKADSPVIPHGFDLAAFPFQPHPHPDLNPTPSELHLLYVGRLDPLKGIDTIIEALPAIQQSLSHLNISVTISSASSDSAQVSSQEYRAKLEAKAQSLGILKLVNFVQTPREKLAALYAVHHILIFPSVWQEPYGLIPLEAMACGTPVIATGTGGSSEYLRNGQNCLLYPPGDSAALAVAVQTLASDPTLQEQLRSQGRTLVEQHYQLTTTITRIEFFLQTLLSE
jgi:glycosyltransferase involved in cell wall biosynthesis